MTLTPYGKSIPPGMHELGAGIRTELGSLIRPGGNVVAYVNSNGDQASYSPDIRSKLVPDLNTALSFCESGKGDAVIIMPDHAENIDGADSMSNLVAGTQILGLGQGMLRPTFTWTVAAATFLLDVANVTLSNLYLKVADTANAGVSVAAPITVSAAGCRIVDCFIHADGDANDLATIPITTTAAADDFDFFGNKCIGATAAECTTFLRLVGADRCRIVGNYFSAASSAVGVGLIQGQAPASTNILLHSNYIANNKAASEAALSLLAASTGYIDHNMFAILDDSTVAVAGIGNCVLGNDNYLANDVAERGVQVGTVSA